MGSSAKEYSEVYHDQLLLVVIPAYWMLNAQPVTGQPRLDAKRKVSTASDSERDEADECTTVKSEKPDTRRIPHRRARSKGLQSLAEPIMFENINATLSEPEKSQLRTRKKPRSKTLLFSSPPISHPSNFIEPALAEPKPIYTGLPLEAFPTAKVKKESLWANKKLSLLKRGKQYSHSSESTSAADSDQDLVSPPSASLPSPAPQEQYERALQTSKSDRLAKPSRERERGPARNPRTNTRAQTPKQAYRDKRVYSRALTHDDHNDEHRVKRIKVISPRKPAVTNLAPSAVKTNEFTGTLSLPNGCVEDGGDTSDSAMANDDFCTTCGGAGIFICCESCPRSFHFTCCEPPLEDCPEDNWHCLECLHKQRKPASYPPSLFGKLMQRLEGRNPSLFMLPEPLRNSTFIGVVTGDNGVYSDSTSKPELTYRQRLAMSQQLPGFNHDRDLEIGALYDKNGKPYLCHCCGLSGSEGKMLAHCDYCPLTWHIDCLNPPLTTVKTIGSKWKCPNHVDDLMMLGLASKCRQFSDTSVLDVSLQSHFLKVANATNFRIMHRGQPQLKAESEVTLGQYDGYEKRAFLPMLAQPFIRPDNIPSGDDLNRIPDFFDHTSVTNEGISAKPNPRLCRILVGADGAVVYRVPESQIIVDFIQRFDSHVKRGILGYIDAYEAQSRLETNAEEAMVVEALTAVQTQSHPITQKLDLDELIKVAAQEQVTLQDTLVSNSELAELRKVKELMELRGRDAMIKFLTPE